MGFRNGLTGALVAIMVAAASSAGTAAPAERPVVGKQVRFANGAWSALPQAGPDGNVRQCVLVAFRNRAGKNGTIETRFALNISRGAGLAITIQDDGLPTEAVLDDQAEVLIDGHSFPAVGFPIGHVFAAHPGDAAGALAALGRATRVAVRSDGAGVDSGAIAINLPAEALNWLKQCGKTFDIAIDKPTDPDAPELPTPRPRSPKVSITPATLAGPAGIEDRQKIEGWDASELRNPDGSVFACFIRRRYTEGSEGGAHRIATQFFASRIKGLVIVLKDSIFNLTEGQPIDATMKIGDDPFTDFSAKMMGRDEIGVFPKHPTALASLLENGTRATIRTPSGYQFEFPVQAAVVPWLRACARRNGIAIEPPTL
jgi:hypothetical protein